MQRGDARLGQCIAETFRIYIYGWPTPFDLAKREKTLAERGFDFADAEQVFAGLTLTLPDERRDYGEDRFQTYGLIEGRLVMVVWTERGNDRHVISMRKCNEREQAEFGEQLG